MVDDNEKTRKLDANYFKNLAQRAKSIQTDNDRTQILGNSPPDFEEEKKQNEDDNKTRIFKPSDRGTSNAAESAAHSEPMEDPPTGWLVAIDGPGKGTVLTLGIGMNGIGRGDVRVTIPFNDEFISRGKSAAIAYDSLNYRFYLLPGDGKTLAYFDSKPVIESKEIQTGDSFTLGKTVFRFVALCGSTFSWETTLD